MRFATICKFHVRNIDCELFESFSFLIIIPRFLIFLSFMTVVLMTMNAPVIAQSSGSQRVNGIADARLQSGAANSLADGTKSSQEEYTSIRPDDAPITVTEFSDFKCPYCAKASSTLAALSELYPDHVRAVFKHYPLSRSAAVLLPHEAALAAGEQGRFWEMHDLLFANQGNLRREHLIEYANQLGLDVERFVASLDGGRLLSTIQRDKEEGERLGVRGTPTFFINDRRLVGAQPLSAFKSLIERELRRLKVAAVADIVDRSAGASVRGPAEAPVTLAVFADFASPLSAQVAALIETLVGARPNDVRVVFKHFPLRFHKEAKHVHRAAVAAGAQGRFWEMHDLLFRNQGRQQPERLETYATELGLDLDRYRESLGSEESLQVVRQDILDGMNRDVRGVPTLFVNGRRLDGLPSLQALLSAIDEEAARVRERPRDTVQEAMLLHADSTGEAP